jgi:hypothetical protein
MRYIQTETYWMCRTGSIDLIPYLRIQLDRADSYYRFDIEIGWLGRSSNVELYFSHDRLNKPLLCECLGHFDKSEIKNNKCDDCGLPLHDKKGGSDVL